MSICFVYFNDSKSARVRSLHLNLWCLPLFGSWNTFFLDIGMLLELDPSTTTTGNAILDINIVLPVDTDDNISIDLCNKLADTQTRFLVFSQTVNVSVRHIIVDGDSVPIIELASKPTKLGEIRAPLSGWRCSVDKSKFVNSKGYVRFRVVVDDCSPLILWQRHGILRSLVGATMDLRINDLRGIYSYDQFRQHEAAVCEIDEFRFFFIAPSWLILELTSPPIHYARIFEGNVWNKYLGRAASWRSDQKFVIYQWKNDLDDCNPITVSKPFRLFSIFHRNPSIILSSAVLRTGLLLVLVLGAAELSINRFPTWSDLVPFIKSAWSTLWWLISIIGLAVGILGFFQITGKRLPRRTRSWIRVWNHKLYGFRVPVDE